MTDTNFDNLVNSVEMSRKLNGIYKSKTLLDKARGGTIPAKRVGRFWMFDPEKVIESLTLDKSEIDQGDSGL